MSSVVKSSYVQKFNFLGVQLSRVQLSYVQMSSSQFFKVFQCFCHLENSPSVSLLLQYYCGFLKCFCHSQKRILGLLVQKFNYHQLRMVSENHRKATLKTQKISQIFKRIFDIFADSLDIQSLGGQIENDRYTSQIQAHFPGARAQMIGY